MAGAEYRLRVLEAYEGEVAGAAYFDGLMLLFPDKAALLSRFAALERETAGRLSVLIRKYRLTPQAPGALAERGALEARSESGKGWQEWSEGSIDAYARYAVEFRALEALGPGEDQPALAALTAHEVQLVDWLRAETRP